MEVRVLNNFAIGDTHLGKSVFAARAFRPGDVITKFTGDILHKSKIPKSYRGERDRFMQVGREEFIGPSGGPDDLINHSCDPNAGLKFTEYGIILIAIKDIEEGEEITWDYSTTMFENPWKMKCDCKKNICRKIVGDFALLNPELQEKYRALNIIPPYIKQYLSSKEYAVYTEGIRSMGTKYAGKAKPK